MSIHCSQEAESEVVLNPLPPYSAHVLSLWHGAAHSEAVTVPQYTKSSSHTPKFVS